jgi:hypothetical protein
MIPHRCHFEFMGRTRWVRNYSFKCKHCHDVYEVDPGYLWKRKKVK